MVEEIHSRRHQHIRYGKEQAEARLVLTLHHVEEEPAGGRIEHRVPDRREEPHPAAAPEEPEHEELKRDVPADAQGPRQLAVNHERQMPEDTDGSQDQPGVDEGMATQQ